VSLAIFVPLIRSLTHPQHYPRPRSRRTPRGDLDVHNCKPLFLASGFSDRRSTLSSNHHLGLSRHHIQTSRSSRHPKPHADRQQLVHRTPSPTSGLRRPAVNLCCSQHGRYCRSESSAPLLRVNERHRLSGRWHVWHRFRGNTTLRVWESGLRFVLHLNCEVLPSSWHQRYTDPGAPVAELGASRSATPLQSALDPAQRREDGYRGTVLLRDYVNERSWWDRWTGKSLIIPSYLHISIPLNLTSPHLQTSHLHTCKPSYLHTSISLYLQPPTSSHPQNTSSCCIIPLSRFLFHGT
jgi:hypothetical protein